jgi:23S rRNA-/tRNA-specific pseudouridylate synthase
VLEQFRGLTWVECRPETGRTHQIRVHMKALGHPLAIDPLYGSSKPLYLSKLKPGYKRKRDAAERPLLARLPLHAAACTFNPPGADPEMLITVEAPLSKDLQIALKLIRRHVHH